MSLRRIAISFHFFIVLLLLVHVFLPHHHHDDIICIEETSHCESHEESGDHEDEDANANHGHHNQTSLCFINQLVVVPDGQSVHARRYCTLDFSRLFINGLWSSRCLNEVKLLKTFTISSYIVILINSYQYYSSPGFRGPPLFSIT